MDILTFKEQVEDKHGPFAQVPLKVLVEEKEIDMDIPVSFLSDYRGMSLAIMWESVGIENFESLGLAGIYYTTWDNMKYNEEELAIHIQDEGRPTVIIKA